MAGDALCAVEELDGVGGESGVELAPHEGVEARALQESVLKSPPE